MAIDYTIKKKKIQERRKERHKTQEKMAELLSVTVGYVSQIERGITKVNLDTLSKIAEILECDVTDFLKGVGENSKIYLFEEMNGIFAALNGTNKKILLEIAAILQKNQE